MKKEIRIRVCLAVFKEDKILLVPHYNTDKGPIQWNLPGGMVEFGENIKKAAIREFEEETGIKAEIVKLLDVSEVIILDKPWHSITISYIGKIKSGKLRAESHHPRGVKKPKWFTFNELSSVEYHPKEVIDKVFRDLI